MYTCGMDSSLPPRASTHKSQYEAFYAQFRWLLGSGSSNVLIPQTPRLEEHPAYRTKKSSRLSFRPFGSRNGIPTSEVNILPTHTEPHRPEHPTTSSEVSHVPLPRSGLRRPSNNRRSQRQPRLDRTAMALNARRSRRQRGQRQYTTVLVRRSWKKYGIFGSHGFSFRSALKNRAIKRSLIRCGLAGFLLIVVLAIYLAFAFSVNSPAGQELHILFILLIMLVTTIFCHSLAYTCLLMMRQAKYGPRLVRIPRRVGPLGYTQPDGPIPVVLARDEETAAENDGAVGEKLVLPPPAYGFWRNSVRINPDIVYWQRVRGPSPNTLSEENCTANEGHLDFGKCPPSYASDNGVDYVVDTQPRSTVAPDHSHFYNSPLTGDDRTHSSP